MERRANKQIALKPQDLVVVIKIAVSEERPFTYSALAGELFMSASEVHACLKRAQLARLVVSSSFTSTTISAVRPALREFLIHGVKYAFPPISGPITRGIPTSHAGPSLKGAFIDTNEMPSVWPHRNGEARGGALYPLYPTVPEASATDPALYDLLTLVDALRVGSARERELAESMINNRIK